MVRLLLVPYHSHADGSAVGSGLTGTAAILGLVVMTTLLLGVVAMWWPRHERHRLVRDAARYLRERLDRPS